MRDGRYKSIIIVTKWTSARIIPRIEEFVSRKQRTYNRNEMAPKFGLNLRSLLILFFLTSKSWDDKSVHYTVNRGDSCLSLEAIDNVVQEQQRLPWILKGRAREKRKKSRVSGLRLFVVTLVLWKCRHESKKWSPRQFWQIFENLYWLLHTHAMGDWGGNRNWL